MASFRVRVDGHRELPEGKVSVSFTSRKPPQKPKKGKGGDYPMTSTYYDDGPCVNIDLPMSQKYASEHPIGRVFKVNIEDTGEDESAAEEKAEKKPMDAAGRAKRIRGAVQKVKAKYTGDDETEE